MITASRFDLLCEKGNGCGFNEGSVSQAKIHLADGAKFYLEDCRAITHPSNNSVFLIQGGGLERSLTLYLYENANNVLLQKPTSPYQMQMTQVSKQAITYNEGFIYLMGGHNARTNKIVKICARYNIVTEKW